MSITGIILTVIIVLIALVMIRASFLSDNYYIEKDILINRPAAAVFDYVKKLRNMENYNKWVMMDPKARKEYKGTDGTVGSVMAWDSDNKNAGKGEQEITNIINGNRVEIEIRFEKPFKGKSNAQLTAVPVANDQTKMTWVVEGTRNFGLKVLHMLLNLKKVLGDDLQISLTNLKAILER